MVWLDTFSLVNSYNLKFTHKVVFQDYELLHGQTLRLNQGANPWQKPVQVELPPRKFRSCDSNCSEESRVKYLVQGFIRDIEDLVTSKFGTDCNARQCM
jgi:hypothetical protein